MLGPAPAVKLRSSPPRGHGVTPDSVFPSPGSSTHVRPLTDVFRDACAASMVTAPSPSTNPKQVDRQYQRLLASQKTKRTESAPWNPLGTAVWFAVSVTELCIDFWPGTVALKAIFVDCTRETLRQPTLRKTRCSGALGEIEP